MPQAETALRINGEELPPLPPDAPQLTLNTRTSGLAFGVLQDTRDSSFLPRRGTTTDLQSTFFRGGIWSDFSYEKLQAGFKSIAVSGSGMSAAGEFRLRLTG